MSRLQILRQTVNNWLRHEPFTYSAAVAFYTLFSFPAVMIILMATTSVLFSDLHLEGALFAYMERILGKDVGEGIWRQAIEQQLLGKETGWAFWFGGIFLLLSSLRLFMQLQRAFNRIWEVVPSSTRVFDIYGYLRKRLLSFLTLIIAGLALALSISTTALLTAAGEWLLAFMPFGTLILTRVLHVAVSWATLSLVFSVILQILPDTKVPWLRALEGGMVSAFLFLLGEYALGIYFDIAEPASAYGVAGSLILFMLWVSYSCLLLLFGAEVSRTRTLLKAGEPLTSEKARESIV